MLHIEQDDDAGCFRLIDDDVGLCVSKSRSVLVRVRDALNAVRETGLIGLTVEYREDTIPNRVDGYPRGVVLGFTGPYLIVRIANVKLGTWNIERCQIVEPERPAKDTPSNEPPIGVRTACELLKRFLTCERENTIDSTLVKDVKKFLKARVDAEPVP